MNSEKTWWSLNPQALERLAVTLLTVYFFVRLVIFACTISPGLPPDELTHVGRVEVFATATLLPQDSPTSFRYGLVTRIPYLYYLLMAKLLLLRPSGIETLLFLRLANVALSMGTISAAYWLASLLTANRLVRILFLTLITNTLMFTFLSSAVSYDNLVNCIAVLSILMLVRFTKLADRDSSLWFWLFVFMGCLTKITFLPLAVTLVLVFVVELWKLDPAGRSNLVLVAKGERFRSAVIGSLVLLALAANLELYGRNLFVHGRVNPRCEQILSHEQCMERGNYARSWIVGRYRNGSTSLEDSALAAAQITDRNTRADVLQMLRNEHRYQLEQPPRMSRLSYVRMVWNQRIKSSIYGVLAHRLMLKPPEGLWTYNLVFLVGFILWLRTIRWQTDQRIWLYLAVVVIGYFSYLVGVVHYNNYLGSHAPFLAVQGRYLFPIIVPAYLLLARSLVDRLPRPVQITLTVLVGAAFVLGDFPYFRAHATPEWFVALN